MPSAILPLSVATNIREANNNVNSCIHLFELYLCECFISTQIHTVLNEWSRRSFWPWSTIRLFNFLVFVGLRRIIILRLLYVSDVCFLQLTTRMSFFLRGGGTVRIYNFDCW